MHTMWKLLVVVGLTFGLSACGGSDSSQANTPTQDTAATTQNASVEPAAPIAPGFTLSGTVHFSGTLPKSTKTKMNADPVCAAHHTADVMDQALLVTDNKLQNVFVYVKEVAGDYPTPAEPVLLDQVGCLYTPRVLGIQVGQKLQIRNSDDTLHNVNCKPKLNKRFNLAQPVQGMTTTKTFKEAETMVSFRCNVHPWMVAYAGILEHPFFAVTDAAGAFTIENLPAGTYTLEAWHESLGTQAQEITIEGTAQTDFTFEL